MVCSKEVKTRIFYSLFSIFFAILFVVSTSNMVIAEQFNIEVQIPETYKTVTPGTEIWFTTNVINLGNTNRIDVVLNSEIVNETGTVKVSKTKTVAMETTASFVNSITLPEDLPRGNYYVVVSITFPDRTVESREQFTIQSVDNKLFRIIGISLGVLIFILIIFFIIKSNKPNIEKMKLHMKIKEIIKKRFKK